MDKIILAALLKLWQAELEKAIAGLDRYGVVKKGRQQIDLENSDESYAVWSVKESISDLILALEAKE
jgi:hypothetical protein